MNRAHNHCPILLVHPDRGEAVYLRDRLESAGVRQPIVISPSVDDARDYLLAASVAESCDATYVPCVALLDERLGEGEVRGLANWIRREPALGRLRIVRLDGEHRDGGGVEPWGTHEAVTAEKSIDRLRLLIARNCEAGN